MTTAWNWDAERFAETARLMATLKAVPVAKVLRNVARDFAHGAYKATPSAATRTSPFLRVPDKRGGTYYRAFQERQAANQRNHGGRHQLTPGMYLHGAMRWIRKSPVARPGLRGGKTPNPPYPVAKGFARASWIGVFRGLGMTSARPAANVPAAALDVGQVLPGDSSLTLVDRLSYIGTLDQRHGLMATGLQRAEETMVRELDREAKRMEAMFT